MGIKTKPSEKKRLSTLYSNNKKQSKRDLKCYEDENEKNLKGIINHMKNKEIRQGEKLSEEVMRNFELILKRGVDFTVDD